jgi:hypothetical protein
MNFGPNLQKLCFPSFSTFYSKLVSVTFLQLKKSPRNWLFVSASRFHNLKAPRKLKQISAKGTRDCGSILLNTRLNFKAWIKVRGNWTRSDIRKWRKGGKKRFSRCHFLYLGQRISAGAYMNIYVKLLIGHMTHRSRTELPANDRTKTPRRSPAASGIC